MGQDRHLQVLGPVDSAFWYLDSSTTPMNLGSVMILDGKVDYQSVVTLIGSRIHEAPLYQQRVETTTLNLGEPTWIFDPHFDVEDHVFHVSLPAPGDEEQLRRLAGRIISSMLDRKKPLWELYLIDGLQGNRSALLLKAHHCMVDGISAVELFTLMLDPSEQTQPLPARLPYRPPAPPSRSKLLRHTVTKALPYRWGLLKKIGGEALEYGLNFLDREKRKKQLFGLVSLVNDHIAPVQKLGINGQNSGRQSMAWAEFSLDTIRAVRRRTRASVNDIMLTILGEGIEEYLRAHDMLSSQNFVRMIIPVNLREEEKPEEEFGNRISVLPIEVPFYKANMLDKLEAVREYTKVMKESALSDGIDMLFTLPAFTPAAAQPLIWAVVPRGFTLVAHMWATNVPGPQFPLYLLGRRLLHINGFFPLNPGMGLATVILSYDGKITMNLIADEAVVSDVKEMRDYLYKAYEQLCDEAKVTRLPVPDDEARYEAPAPFADATPHAGHNGHSRSPEKVTILARPEDANPELAPEKETAEVEEATPAAVLDDNGLNNGGDVVASEPRTFAAPVAAPASAKAAEAVAERKLFSPEWAAALQEAINGSAAYKEASLGWTAGSMAFIMKASPRHGYPSDSAVLLDLHQGVCRSGKAVAPADARRDATFLLEATHDHWMEVLEGRSQPLPMIMRGKLKLAKGSLRKLMPFTRSAQELVKCAQRVS